MKMHMETSAEIKAYRRSFVSEVPLKGPRSRLLPICFRMLRPVDGHARAGLVLNIEELDRRIMATPPFRLLDQILLQRLDPDLPALQERLELLGAAATNSSFAYCGLRPSYNPSMILLPSESSSSTTVVALFQINALQWAIYIGAQGVVESAPVQQARQHCSTSRPSDVASLL